MPRIAPDSASLIQYFQVYSYMLRRRLPWGKSASKSRSGSYFSSSSSSELLLVLLEDSSRSGSLFTFTGFTSESLRRVDPHCHGLMQFSSTSLFLSAYIKKLSEASIRAVFGTSLISNLLTRIFNPGVGSPGFRSSVTTSDMVIRSASRGSEGTLFFSSLMVWTISSAPCRVVGKNTGTGTWRGQGIKLISNHITDLQVYLYSLRKFVFN